MAILKNITLTFFLILSIGAFAQQETIDSLKNIIKTTSNDTLKVNTLLALSSAHLNIDIQEAIEYGNEAKNLAKNVKFHKGEAYAYKAIALGHFYQANYPEAIIQFQFSLAIFDSIQFKVGIANILSNLGASYFNAGEDTKAIDFYLRSLQISEEINDKLRIGTALNNIGGVYNNKPATEDKALEYFLKALPIFKEIDYPDVRNAREWVVIDSHLGVFDSMFRQMADPNATPEVLRMREQIRGWRFYDHFRTDRDAPARQPQLGTRTPVLQHDGRDLAAALQTIREIGDTPALDLAISDAFPGARLDIVVGKDGRFVLQFYQHGLLRPLSGAELSDGTLRYLLWVAALLTPRPPELMVLNEPETSLHPDLLPALARLIVATAERSQVWVVSHANRLIGALNEHSTCHSIELDKDLGETKMVGQGMLDAPVWRWPD